MFQNPMHIRGLLVARPYCDVVYMVTMNHTTGMNLEVTL